MSGILVLYTELADYTIQCFNKLALNHQVQIHIVRYEVNNEAPFLFKDLNPLIKLYPRKEHDETKIQELVVNIKPNLIYCAGWSDKVYLNVIKKNYKDYSTLLGFDNQWHNSLKQNIASVIFPLTLTRYFDYCFVPGVNQEKFALKIGFKKEQIRKNAYCCNLDAFQSYYERCHGLKRTQFPKRFIYVGRYYDFKGINEMWQAFAELQNEQPNDWELWCLGTGTVKPFEHPKIKHFGFVQPSEMPKFIEQTGVFVLPSRFEPWGVVVHEFAAAGFPMILSSEVGARTMFLKEEQNGFQFKANNKEGLKMAFRKMMELSEDQLLKMAEKSNELSRQITPDKWAETLFNLIKN